MNEKDKVLYKWTSAGGCDACEGLDGMHEEAPKRPHPNCKCIIEKVVASNYTPNPKDTLEVKRGLNKLGYYEPPTGEIHKFTDSVMYEAIKSFQRDNELTVDGRMNPDGETIKAVNEKLNPNLKDLELVNRVKQDVMRFEGYKNFPYLDTKNNITVGVGKNVNNKDVFKSVNWIGKDGNKLSENEALREYNKLAKIKIRNGENNYQADYFEDKSNLRITKNEAERLLEQHLQNNVRELKGKFSDFDKFSEPVREALLDMQYNLGGVLNKQDWQKLFEALDKNDLARASEESRRKEIAKERNEWTRKKFLESKKLY